MVKIYLIAVVCALFSHSVIAQDKVRESYYKSYNYEKMGNYQDAIKALSVVYKKFPTGYTLNYRLGYLHYSNHNYANSTEYYEKAIKALPTALDAKLGLVSVLIAQQKYEKAETLAYQIVNTDYYNYYGNLRLSYILRMQDKGELAEQVLLKMLAIYPIDSLFLADYGVLKYYQKDFAAAQSIFEDILILDPENITAKEFLSLMEQ